MNDTILKQLKFGFEVEGMFRKGLNEKLGNKGDFKHDGSVRASELGIFSDYEHIPTIRSSQCGNCSFEGNQVLQYCDRHRAIYHNEGNISTEYASVIYEDFKTCLDDLKQFNKRNYSFNNSCGLHFHIGVKEPSLYKKLFGIATNFKYLKQLREEAMGYCDCQNARLVRASSGGSHYYNFWANRKQLSQSMRSSDKYRFVRFHNVFHTLEWRFLMPCEHKVENVHKLVNSLTAYLGRDESEHMFRLVETESEQHDVMDFSAKVPIAGSTPLAIVKKIIRGAKQAAYRENVIVTKMDGRRFQIAMPIGTVYNQSSGILEIIPGQDTPASAQQFFESLMREGVLEANDAIQSIAQYNRSEHFFVQLRNIVLNWNRPGINDFAQAYAPRQDGVGYTFGNEPRDSFTPTSGTF